jgi:hypothetical protein
MSSVLGSRDNVWCGPPSHPSQDDRPKSTRPQTLHEGDHLRILEFTGMALFSPVAMAAMKITSVGDINGSLGGLIRGKRLTIPTGFAFLVHPGVKQLHAALFHIRYISGDNC